MAPQNPIARQAPHDAQLSLSAANLSLISLATPMQASGVCLRRRGLTTLPAISKIA
jgi:hypothetical protein